MKLPRTERLFNIPNTELEKEIIGFTEFTGVGREARTKKAVAQEDWVEFRGRLLYKMKVAE